MVGYIIGFVLSAIAFLGLIILSIFGRDVDGDSVGLGIGIVVCFAFFIGFTSLVFYKEETYYEKYRGKIDDIKECKIDTTFTTTNGVTDTTYTVYYNAVKKDINK